MKHHLHGLLFTISCALAVGCGASDRHNHLRDTLQQFDDRRDPHLDARRKALLHELDAEPTWTVIRRAELRLEGVELTDSDTNQAPQYELRFPLQNPWRLGAERRLHLALVETSFAGLEQDAIQSEVRRCTQSTRAQAYRLQTQLWNNYNDDLQALTTWHTTLHSNQHISDARFQSRLLAYKSRLLRTAPGAPPPKPDIAVPNPLTFAPNLKPLDTNPETLKTLLLHHPLWAGYEAEEDHMHAASAEETAKRLPWIQWISFSLETSRQNSQDDRIEAMIAFALPLGIDERSHAKAYDARAAALRWKARGLFEQHYQRLFSVLEALKRFESHTSERNALAQDAEQQRSKARRWIAQRAVTPQEAEDLIENIFDIKRTLLTQQEEAALLRCEALALTGKPQNAWPRN